MDPIFQTTGRACALILGSLLTLAGEGCAASRGVPQHVASSQSEAWPGAPMGQLTLPPAPTLSGDTRRLTFLFCAPAGRRTAHAIELLQQTLLQAGYRLELNPKAHHDARIEVHFEQDGDADAVEMTLDRDGRQIESIIGPLAPSEAGMRATLEEIVTRLTLSPRIANLTDGGGAIDLSRESSSERSGAPLAELALRP